MNTNQQTQSNSTTNTTNGQDRFVELNQGGALFRIYRNYDFKPFTENKWDKNIIKEYIDIGKDLLCNLSENKVVQIRLPYQKIKLEKRDFFDRWTPPVFVENGKTNEFKKNLTKDKYGKQLWADYMWYNEEIVKSFFWNLNSTIRCYRRYIYVIQEKLDLDLVIESAEHVLEESGGLGIRIFPHSKIEHLENDKETVRSYVHREDFIVQIAFGLVSAHIVIQVNHEYMSYDQMLEITEPLFEKRGIKIKDKTDPYIYANYPPDYVEHNKYPCAGYQFFD